MHLSGGLGNQMFQYAMGRALAIKNNDILELDISDFGKLKCETLREYGLDVFNIKAKVASKNKIEKLKKTNIVKRILNRLGTYLGPFIAEKSYNFDERMLWLTGDIYLYGFWQSWKYFVENSSTIRKEFTLRNDLSLSAKKILKNIVGTNCPVSLHVRTGDYFSNQEYKKMFCGCGVRYYQKAIDYLLKINSRSIFFVFSKDLDWVKNNLNLPTNSIFINGLDYEDMFLMSCCKHNIIANSSFSWWGAWLNNHPNKIVIYPKKWFSNRKNIKDLVPFEWVGL